MAEQNNKYKVGIAAGVLAAAGLFFNGNYAGNNTSQNNGIDNILKMSTAYANASENKNNLEAKIMGTEAKTIDEPVAKIEAAEDAKYTEAIAEDESMDYMKYVGLAKNYENERKYSQAICAYLEAAKRLESKDAKIVDYTDSKYSKDGKMMGKKLYELRKTYANVARNYNQIKDYENAYKYGRMGQMLDSINNDQNINSEIEKAKKGLCKSRDISMLNYKEVK